MSRPIIAAHQRGRRGPGVVVALLAVGVLIVAALLLGIGHHGHKGPTGGGLLAPIPIAAVNVWIEPPQNTPDHPEEVRNTFDGNSRTEWESVPYYSSAFGGYGGEGLAIHLSSDAPLHQLKVTSYTSGWAASTYVSDSSPSALAGWGSPSASQSNIAGSTTFDLGGRKGSWVLLWMTNTGPGLQIGIAELAVS